MNKGFNEEYMEGDDVPTIIGLGSIRTDDGQNIKYPCVWVDYAGVREDIRESYSKSFEEGWEGDHFHKGFDINRVAPTQVSVSSKRKMMAMEFGKETNILNAPSLQIEVSGGKDIIDTFFKAVDACRIWVLHLRTTKHSYVWVVDGCTGEVRMKVRKDPCDVIHEERS